MRWRSGPLGVLLVGAVLCLSACQATIHVGIDVNQNGGGVVTVTAHLDHDAAPFAQDVRTSDLASAGWKVVGPTPSGEGSVEFTASKAFADPAQASAVVTELSGSSGPFRDMAVASHHSFFQTSTSLRGTVDLRCGLNCFADPQLQQALGGAANLGIDSSKLQADSGITISRLFQFDVAARLPGKVTSNAPSTGASGAVWKAQMGQTVMLAATARAWNVPHLALVVVIILVLAGIGLAVLKRQRRRSRPAQRR